MPITRVKKEEVIKMLHEKTGKSDIVLFMNFHGLSVSNLSGFRKMLRAIGADIKVAKKRLMRRVLDGFGFSGDMPKLEGEVAMLFKTGDVIEAAKMLTGFVKKNEGLKVLGGVFEKKYISTDTVKTLAMIPSREVLIGQLVAVLASPLKGVMRAFNGPAQNLVGVLYNLSNKRK